MKQFVFAITILGGGLLIQGCDNQNNADHSQTETIEGTTTGTDVTGVGGTEATINNEGVDSAIDSSAAVEAPVQTP